jgi:hypothetical protein
MEERKFLNGIIQRELDYHFFPSQALLAFAIFLNGIGFL